MKTILVVEDEITIARLLETALKVKDWSVDVATDGQLAADYLEQTPYDLVLLDIMLPKIDGYELFTYCEQLQIPVIFITAKSSVEDRVKGLQMGAYDYIIKPFEIAELLARVENVLRRKRAETKLRYRHILVDLLAHQVYRGEVPVALTLKEYELFVYLVQNQGLALSREQITQRVWHSYDRMDSRTIDIHIRQLRKKLDLKEEIETVFRFGYKLKEDAV